MAKALKPMAPKPMAPQTPAHAAEMARRAKRQAEANARGVAAKKADDAEQARRLNNRLGRGKRG
jgi:hypothetical protein